MTNFHWKLFSMNLPSTDEYVFLFRWAVPEIGNNNLIIIDASYYCIYRVSFNICSKFTN
jgi:hypothetical protein